MKPNPYSLMFGKEPMASIPRREETDRILSSFCAEQAAQQVFMLTGVRGSGKTVLMTEIARKIAKRKDWICVELNPECNLLEDLLTKLSSNQSISTILSGARINLSFFGIGIDVKGTVPITNVETALSRILDILQKKNKRVLITIDEVYSNQNMRVFAHAYQIFVRQGYPLFLLMTGLYQNIDALQNEKGLTFLYRAPKIWLSPLSVRMIAQNYKEAFKLQEQDAARMAALTNGYSYAFQVLGYLTWESGGTYADVRNEYLQYLSDYSYDKIWSELSEQDQKIAAAVAQSETGKIADIREALQMDTNHFNPYRKRLIQKGILDGNRYGYLTFTLPLFDEYIQAEQGLQQGWGEV